MEWLILGILGAMAMAGKGKGSLKNEKNSLKVDFQSKNDVYAALDQFPDRGDSWKAMRRNLNELSDIKTMSVFNNLLFYVKQFNQKENKNMQIFEAVRPIQRQKRLLGSGKSQVNLKFAPHVQRRAVDFAELKNGVWVWNSKDLERLNDYLFENFPQWDLLRTGRDFKNFVDWPHYEIKRSIWKGWQ